MRVVYAALIAFGIYSLLQLMDIGFIEFRLYDTLFTVTPQNRPDPRLVVVGYQIQSLKSGEVSKMVGLKDHDFVLEKILRGNPSQVIFMGDPPEYSKSQKQVSQFIRKYLKEKNFYFAVGDEFSARGLPKNCEEYNLSSYGVPPEKDLWGCMVWDEFVDGKDSVVRRYTTFYLRPWAFTEIAINAFEGKKAKPLRGEFWDIAKSYSQIYIDHRKPGAYPLYKYSDFFDLKISDKEFRDKIVLVGAIDDGAVVGLSKKTPTNKERFGELRVNIGASIIDTIIHDTSIKKFSNVEKYFYSILMLTLISFFSFFSKRGILFDGRASIVVVIVYSIYVWLQFHLFRNWMPLMEPLVGSLSIIYISLPFRLVGEARKRARIEKDAEFKMLQARVATKSAKADLGFRLAVQVAHDMKSPLSAIDTVASLAESGWKGEYNKMLKDSSRRLKGIGEDLIGRYRRGSFQMENIPQSTDVVGCLSSLVEEYSKGKYQEIEFQFHTSAQSLFVSVDQVKLERAVSNIINNAVEALSGKGKIILTIVDHETEFEILISDNGPGIPSQIQEQIFERGATLGKKEGSGLGLFQARKVFRDSGGDLTVFSTNREGTVFQGKLRKDGQIKSELNVQKHLVLIEDVKESRDIWSELLTTAFIKFEIYNNPNEFYRHYQDRKGDLFSGKVFTLVTDLVFDGFDDTGFDVVDFIKKNKSNYLRETILCTSLSSNPEIARIAKDLGVRLIGKSELNNLTLIAQG